MTPTPPRRHKTPDELTPAEHAARQAGGAAPETDEYCDYVRRVHERAGLDAPADDRAKTLDDMTPEDHANRKYGSTR